jgi:hypothetical protein
MRFSIKGTEVTKIAGLAQLVEHLICNQGVTSSNLVAGTSVFNDLARFVTLPNR